MDISGRKVLITGGAVRIGRAICAAFANAGAKVVINCNRSYEQACELRDELTGSAELQVIRSDLSSPEAIKDMFAACGKVDILVNNASVYRPCGLFEETEHDLREHMEVNFFAPLELMRLFVRQPGIAGSCIINILDQEIAQPPPSNAGGYSLSKRALAEATLAGARLAAPDVRVNGIAPGPTLAPPGKEHLGMRKTLTAVPLGRAVALDDLTEACLFLARNESITGQILYVDCGQHLI